jgi:hypothetical protein
LRKAGISFPGIEAELEVKADTEIQTNADTLYQERM